MLKNDTLKCNIYSFTSNKVTRGDGAAGPKGPTRANAVPFPATLARGNPSRTPYHSFLISCFFPTVYVFPRAPNPSLKRFWKKIAQFRSHFLLNSDRISFFCWIQIDVIFFFAQFRLGLLFFVEFRSLFYSPSIHSSSLFNRANFPIL